MTSSPSYTQLFNNLGVLKIAKVYKVKKKDKKIISSPSHNQLLSNLDVMEIEKENIEKKKGKTTKCLASTSQSLSKSDVMENDVLPLYLENYNNLLEKMKNLDNFTLVQRLYFNYLNYNDIYNNFESHEIFKLTGDNLIELKQINKRNVNYFSEFIKKCKVKASQRKFRKKVESTTDELKKILIVNGIKQMYFLKCKNNNKLNNRELIALKKVKRLEKHLYRSTYQFFNKLLPDLNMEKKKDEEKIPCCNQLLSYLDVVEKNKDKGKLPFYNHLLSDLDVVEIDKDKKMTYLPPFDQLLPDLENLMKIEKKNKEMKNKEKSKEKSKQIICLASLRQLLFNSDVMEIEKKNIKEYDILPLYLENYNELAEKMKKYCNFTILQRLYFNYLDFDDIHNKFEEHQIFKLKGNDLTELKEINKRNVNYLTEFIKKCQVEESQRKNRKKEKTPNELRKLLFVNDIELHNFIKYKNINKLNNRQSLVHKKVNVLARYINSTK